MPRLLRCLLPLLLLTASAFAQATEPIVIGHRLTLHSDLLGEDRPVLVYTPAGYEHSQEKYPVLVLLDGDGHFHHTTGLLQYLVSLNYMPEMLVVALPNTQRTRDLSPPTSDTETFPTAGGADRFLDFIADELLPHVEANYRTQPYRMLVGHSFGGLFAVHALLTRPDVFDAYVAISPSLWWNDRATVKNAEAFFEAHADLTGSLYMTIGNEGGDMLPAAQAFADVLTTKAPDGFEWQFVHMPEETHGSIPHRTTYDALETIFAPWRLDDPFTLATEGGLAAIDAHYAALSERFGYMIRTPEALVNQLGYQMMQQGKAEEAIALFERNVAEYPDSPNVHDSLGDGYAAAGRLEDARESYARAVRRGEAIGDTNLAVYQANLERVRKELGEL